MTRKPDSSSADQDADRRWDYRAEPPQRDREAPPLRDEPTAVETPPAQAQQTPQQQPLTEEIRKLAHKMWEDAGRPEGAGDKFWLAAEQMLNTQLGTYAGQTQPE